MAIRASGVAAAAGGAMWIAKGGAILAGGDQPSLVFALAPLFFALGLIGVRALVPSGERGRLHRIGTALALAAIVLGGVTAAGALAFGEDDKPAAFDATLGLGTLATFAALGCLGLAARRAGAGAGSLALAMGVAFVPLLLAGGALSVFGERLLEVPIVLLGAAWIVLGAALALRRDETRESAPAAAR